MYEITQYTFDKAKEIKGLVIKPSNAKNKKIDVYLYGEKLFSIGDSRYKDFPTYLKLFGEEYANKRRELYKKRHNKDRNIKWSKGWFADQLLW